MSVRVANSSDLDRARALARRLAGPDGPPVERPRTAGGYVRFASAGSAPAPRGLRVLEAPPPSPPPAVVPPPPRALESLEALLQWAAETAEAAGGFLVDSQGFVIAHRGAPPTDGFDALGAELYLAFEQLERLDSTAGRLVWLDLEFGKRRLAAFRARAAGRPELLVGLLGPSPAYADRRHLLEQVVLDHLPRLG